MRTTSALAAALCCVAAVAAQGGEPATRSAGGRPVEHVVVISHPLSAEGLALASEVLEGEDLARKLQSSIGETVGREPGVHAANFGQAASRPVIHGLSGPRVRMMEDRIDALDASVTSADHAVTIEPFIADRIEVLKGPSTLLYGSGAIGGVVDVHTGRIPHEPAARPWSGRLETRYADNAERKTVAGRLDGGAGAVAWHVDGFTREADAYEIPGFAESELMREREAAEGEEPGEAEGRLPGSEVDADGGAVGISLVGDRGFAGVALSVLGADYGLPGGHHHEEPEPAGGHAGETPRVDLDQTRVDLEAGLSDPLPGFQSLNVRVGINDYRHREIEPGGAIATTFDNEAVEGRVELTHHPVAGWGGAFGIQYGHRDLSAVGEEAFIPPVDTTSFGAFWVAERSFASFDLEGGVRIESVEVDPRGGGSETFTSHAASVGLIVPFGEAWSLGLLADYATRAPIAEELYSFGPHLATGAFQVGNPDLDEEKALNLAVNLRYAGERWFFSGTAYYNDFSEFIYEAPAGTEQDGLPVQAFTQDDATFAGLDAEVRATVAEGEAGSLELSARFDTVRGQVDVPGNDHLPRMPPTRYGLGVAGHWGIVRASLDHLWVRDQNDVADFELPTDGYRDLRAFVGADLPVGGEVILTVFVQGRNLTDDDQRQHPSFIKDSAPMPGRTVEAGLRARF
jgi:iron complex outermembrane receptor protein